MNGVCVHDRRVDLTDDSEGSSPGDADTYCRAYISLKFEHVILDTYHLGLCNPALGLNRYETRTQYLPVY